MSNVKISQLPAGTTPLAGTELVPIVQSGTTSKVTAQDVANLGAPGPTGPPGPGVPNGGTTGQVLAKASNADQDTAWSDSGNVKQIATPPAPILTVQGTPGTTTVGYRIVATNSVGLTDASPEAVIHNAPDVMNVTNYITITVPNGVGVDAYNIYRTTAGGTPNTVGAMYTIVPGTSFDDQGFAPRDPGVDPTLFLNTTSGIDARLATLESSAYIGGGNCYVGYGCGASAIPGNCTGNVAVGSEALGATQSTALNVAVGQRALFYNTTGGSNTAIGQALYFNTTGVSNTAVGDQSLYYMTTGSFNVGIGMEAGCGITSGNNNVIITPGGPPDTAGNKIITGSDNVALGYEAGATGDFSNTIAVGKGAAPAASNTGVIGNADVTDVAFGGAGAAAILHAKADALVFPDADPHVAGAAYWVAGVLTKSAG